jgi:hypothetical protein
MIKFNLRNLKSVARVAKTSIIKHSPEILMGVGTASFVATVVTASKATIKAQDILEIHHSEIEDIKEAADLNDPDYTAEDVRKDKIVLYSQTSLAMAKNYAPAAAFAILSLTCFFGAFSIMKKRYTVLAAAYTALEESFRAYRQRVIEDKGEDVDLYYMTGQKVKEVTVKDENGQKTKQKQLILPDGTILSPYAFKFGKYKENGELNHQWTGNSVLDRAYLLGQQDYLNDQLYMRCIFDDDHKVLKRGWVFLNETRDLAGEDPTATGAVVGNLFGNGEPGRDGYIDFRLVEATDENGSCFYINPNVDGLIYDIVEKFEKKPFALSGEYMAVD